MEWKLAVAGDLQATFCEKTRNQPHHVSAIALTLLRIKHTELQNFLVIRFECGSVSSE